MTDHIPHGETARRLQWSFLPPLLRREIERCCGGTVVDAVSCDAGFTPGMASVLTLDDGSRHFVKAASVKAQRVFADAYRQEAAVLRTLPEEVAAPRLHWTLGTGVDDAAPGWDDWIVLGIEFVEGAHPARPWRAGDLDAVLARLDRTADLLTPAPGDLPTAAEEFAGWPALWQRTPLADLPFAAEFAALAARYTEFVGGSTLVHTDLRDDNVLLHPTRGPLLCDWNWPVVGADWIDTVLMLIGPRGDGLDVETILATHPRTAGLHPDAVDSWLALACGYFLHSAAQPAPSTSPWVRVAQRWQGEVCREWVCERRGWTASGHTAALAASI